MGEWGFLILWCVVGLPLVGMAIWPLTIVIQNVFRERRQRMVRDVINEKLDVIKTAVAMGYSEVQLAELDERLERLVGSDKLGDLLGADVTRTELEATTPLRPAELAASDLPAAGNAEGAQQPGQLENES